MSSTTPVWIFLEWLYYNLLGIFVILCKLASYIWAIYLKWLNWFHFLILIGRFAHILIGCIIFLSLFLDLDVVLRMSMSTVSFLAQLMSFSRLWNFLPVECFLSSTCDLNGFKLIDTFFLWTFSTQLSYILFILKFSSLSCNSMPHWVFSLLLGVKHNFS